MAAQIGYYDSLKSVAGKVFAYLSSITLTGTDGKTITCTQDTTLDEAVAMSSKAPKVSPALTTPSLGVATATSVNGLYSGAGTLTAIPVSSTKTITITATGTAVIDADFSFFGAEASGYGRQELSAGGWLDHASYYAVTEAKVQSANVVVSTVTKAAGSLSFTVQNTHGALTVEAVYKYTSSVPLTITIQ